MFGESENVKRGLIFFVTIQSKSQNIPRQDVRLSVPHGEVFQVRIVEAHQ